MDGMGRKSRVEKTGRRLLLLILFSLPAFPALPASPAFAAAQIPYDQALGGLSSNDPKVRLRSATLLKESAFVESAVPLAKLVADPDNAVQLEAIAAEVNIFAAGRPRGTPQQVFDAGPLAIGPQPVPPEVLRALREAVSDDSPRVGVDALYAFGALGTAAAGRERRELLQMSQKELSALLSLPDPAVRLAAVRVIGRLYERRPGDAAVDEQTGNLLIAAVNESDRAMKLAAMDALGAIGERRAVDGLTQLLQFYGPGDLGEGALAALARIGDSASAPTFRMQLSARSTPLKIAAVEGLGRAGNADDIPAIEKALNRERDDRAFVAGVFASAMLTDGSIERLVDALNRPKTHDRARQYLVEITRRRVLGLSRYAQDPSPRMRMDIADIAGLADDPRGLAIVEPMLKDADPQVAMAAERASRRLKMAR